MGTTASGLRYADSSSAATLWTHFQNLATDVDTYISQKVANKAARLALTGVNTGRIVVESDTGKTWMRGPSGWIYLGGPPGTLFNDTTATNPATTGITPATGWTLGNRYVQNLGNGMAFLSCTVASTGTVTVDPNGDVTNVTVANVPAAWSPRTPYAPMHTIGTGRMAVGYLQSTNVLRLSGTTPGGNIAAGDLLELAGFYPLADPSAV